MRFLNSETAKNVSKIQFICGGTIRVRCGSNDGGPLWAAVRMRRSMREVGGLRAAVYSTAVESPYDTSTMNKEARHVGGRWCEARDESWDVDATELQQQKPTPSTPPPYPSTPLWFPPSSFSRQYLHVYGSLTLSSPPWLCRRPQCLWGPSKMNALPMSYNFSADE